MKTTLVHSGSSASLASLPNAGSSYSGFMERVSSNPNDIGELDFTPAPKEDNDGWLKHKFR